MIRRTVFFCATYANRKARFERRAAPWLERGCSRANWKTTAEAEKTLVPLALAAGERMPLVPR